MQAIRHLSEKLMGFLQVFGNRAVLGENKLKAVF